MQLTQQEQKKLRTFADSIGISYQQAIGEEKISQNLNLNHLSKIPKGFNPKTTKSLDLSELTSIPEGFNPTVGGSLYLSGLTSIPEGFNPTVGWHLCLSRLISVQGDFHPTVGEYLDLSSLTSIQGDFHPTVGWSFYLSRLTSIQGDFHPTVGWHLYLSNITSIQGATLPDCRIRTRSLAEGEHEAANGQYLCADGILQRIVSRHGNAYKLRTKDKISYCITDGAGTYAHGETLRDAYSDLRYKLAEREEKEQWKTRGIDEQLPLEQAIACYRVITGACQYGIEEFIESRQLSKESYSIKEIITLTEGAYGHGAFKEFFQVA